MSKALWSFLYLGYNPVLPGTAGSMGGLLVYLAVMRLPGGVVLGPHDPNVVPSPYYDEIDPKPCVIDEGCGMLVSLVGIATVPIWKGAVLAFLLFRLYDALKPFPVGRAEKLGGGWGIAMDDVVAGIYANVSCQVLLWASAAVFLRLH